MPGPQASFVSVPCGPAGSMDAYFAEPAAPKGALVVVQEIFGVTDAMRAIADDFAEQGFAALVPDIFWRMQRRAELGNGEDEAKRKIAIDLMQRFDLAAGVNDLLAAADWLRARGVGRVGIVGFCLGGRLTALVAAKGKDRIAAAASFYGVKLEDYLGEIASIAMPVQFHFGAEDNQVPPPTIDKVRAALGANAGRAHEVFVYPGAQHAFYNRHRKDRFDPTAHKLARERTLAFLHRALA